MSHLRLPTSTTEFIKVRVRLENDTVDPRVDFTPYFAIVDHDATPVDDDFVEAEWQIGEGPPYYARNIFHQEPGVYKLWIMADSESETIVRESGLIEFY